MQIKNGPNEHEWASIVQTVSREHYDGNLTTTGDEYTTGVRSVTLNRARIRALDSGYTSHPRDTDFLAKGARRAHSGRRTVAACWHTYRDVLALLFARYPNAKVITAMAIYDGRDGFYTHYPETGHVNVGSQAYPATMLDYCECSHSNPYTDGIPFNDEIPEYLAASPTPAHPQTAAINDEFGWDDAHVMSYS